MTARNHQSHPLAFAVAPGRTAPSVGRLVGAGCPSLDGIGKALDAEGRDREEAPPR